MATQLQARSSVEAALSVRTCRTLDAMDELSADWTALELRSPGPSFFQSYAWCRTVAGSLASRGDPEAGNLRIVVVSDHGKVVAIWPLQLRRSLGGLFAVDLTDPFAQYSDALVSPDVDAKAVLSHAWDEIRSWQIDGMILRKVRADAAIRPWIEAAGQRVGSVELAPFVALSQFDSLADYRKTITAKTRKNLRNYRNRLARDGVLENRVVTNIGERAGLTRTCLDWRQGWLQATGLSSTAFQHTAFPDVIASLADGEQANLDLIVMQLVRISGGQETDVAIQWGFRHNGRYYAFMSAKNPDFDGFSPGRLHLEDVVTACSQLDLDTVDFLVPDMPYKATWATGNVAVESFGVAITARGRMVVAGWHGWMRPKIKAAIVRVPPGVRRVAASAGQLVKSVVAGLRTSAGGLTPSVGGKGSKPGSAKVPEQL